VEQATRRQLAEIERRSRTLTGMLLAVMAFLASYSIMLVEGQIERPIFHLYPWIAAIICYIGGDLLALVWFKVVVLQVLRVLQAEAAVQTEQLDAELARRTAAEQAASAPEG
jgi:hypothetical protein